MGLEATYFAILGALMLGAMSPGPSFVVVAQRAVSLSRKDGIACAVGTGLSAAILDC